MWMWALLACTELPITETGPDDVAALGEVVETAHPCIGHRTDTVLLLDDQRFWVGCGTTTSGYGLYETTDGGATWGLLSTAPANILDDRRINDLVEHDGLVYASTDEGVVSIEPSSGAVTTVFENGNQTWNNFLVGTYRQTADGLEVAESLNGVGIVYRSGPTEDWQDGYGWWTDPFGMQILDMETYDGRVYGVGSTISQPPMLFVPAAAGFGFSEVALSDSFIGEMWDVHVDDGGVVASGVDQEADEGVVLFTDHDGAESFVLRVNAQLGADEPTWVHSSCRVGDAVMVLGEYSMRGEGFVLYSSDGGDTWTAPFEDRDWPAMHQCAWSDTQWVLVGAEGFVAVAPR